MNNYTLIYIAFTAALAGILFGYDTGVMSGAILFIDEEFGLTAAANGAVVGAVLLGAFLGAIISGWAADYLGRKKLLIITACAFIIGSVETAQSPSIYWLTGGRIFIGMAIGIASYTAPLYISEISPSKHRGALVSLNQLAISIGILISYIVNYCCASYAVEGEWRWMLGLGVVPAVMLLAGMAYLPCSPRWMLSKGNEAEARRVLRKIRGGDAEVNNEIDEIKRTLNDNVKDWKVLFSARVRPALWIGFGLAIIQQITGINTILYYAPTIFKMSGFETHSAAILATMGIGAVFVAFTLISLRLIDTLGRRPLLLAGLTGMIIGLAFLSWVFNSAASESLHVLTVGSMLLYIASFAMSLGPVVWLMISEIYPLRVRGVGASLATCVNWMSNLLVTATFLLLIELVDASGTFMLYLALSVLSLFFVYYLVPETKDVSLEEIEANLMAGKPWRELGKTTDTGVKHDLFSRYPS